MPNMNTCRGTYRYEREGENRREGSGPDSLLLDTSLHVGGKGREGRGGEKRGGEGRGGEMMIQEQEWIKQGPRE